MRVIESGDCMLLRREPPDFLGIVNAVNELELLVKRQLASRTGRAVGVRRIIDAGLTLAPAAICVARGIPPGSADDSRRTPR